MGWSFCVILAATSDGAAPTASPLGERVRLPRLVFLWGEPRLSRLCLVLSVLSDPLRLRESTRL